MDCDVIKLLPDSVANQIAAGEVIQRPASVIKELVENAVDAGATVIKIYIKDAGRTLIQVVDNGRGMSETDARMAFERHATSKIKSADDLYTLHTMGFRGEALPSIAAVAQVEVRTMRQSDTIGTRVLINESIFERQEPFACTPGTNMMVKNLFFHMPARRKFLKKDSVEFGHILHEFERLALINTNVEFHLYHNDQLQKQLVAGTFKYRISSLFGRAINSQIIPLDTESTVVRITGFVGLPQYARRRNAPQYLFVNGRFMRDQYFHKCIYNCYTDLIAPDFKPIYFVNFEVDPATIDVNIHPQKHEIKFENEQIIWSVLTAAVKQALGKVNAAGAIDFDADQRTDLPAFLPDQHATMPEIGIDPAYNPFSPDALRETPDTDTPPSISERPASIPGFTERPARRSAPMDWEKLYDNFTARRDDDSPSDIPSSINHAALPLTPDTPDDTFGLVVGHDHAPAGTTLCLHNKYLVVTSRNGLLIIDRRRAHTRVLYDRFMLQLRDSTVPSQKLIFPEILTLSPARSSILSSISDLITRFGFEVSFLGDNSWSVISAPALQGNINPVETITSMIADIEEAGVRPDEEIFRPAAISLARAAAIPAGQVLSDQENDTIISQLFTSAQPDYTPDGQRIIAIVSNDEISKLFL